MTRHTGRARHNRHAEETARRLAEFEFTAQTRVRPGLQAQACQHHDALSLE